MDGFIEIEEGLWYCEKDGSPWSSRRGWKKLTAKNNGYYTIKGVYWHRMVWEYYNGPIEQNQVVHHINHNPLDNTCYGCGKIKKIVSRKQMICKTCENKRQRNRHCKIESTK